MSLPTNSTSNNQSNLITLNIYNNQNIKIEESTENINDIQEIPINNLNNNNYATKKSVMLPQNNYLYLDNVRGNNYPLSDNLRNQIYPNYNLNALNQYGYNGQNNPILNNNYNSPNGNPVKIVNPNIQPTGKANQNKKRPPKHSKKSITCVVIIVIICIGMAVGLTSSIK